MTGFQTSIGKKRKPFLAPYAGRVVAWSIKLGKPRMKRVGDQEISDFAFFVDEFGGPPRARLSVLKPIKRKKRVNYQLKSQSPTELLTPFLGQTTTFTLQSPLKVAKGHILALTVPTWAPMFVADLPLDYTWRASRSKKKGCFIRNEQDEILGSNIKAGKPQQALNSERAYDCQYSTNRLLYSAVLVERPAGN